jgi:hypothetical protein
MLSLKRSTVMLCCVLMSVQPYLALGVHAQQTANGPKPLVLEDATPIKLRIAQSVSSADANVNDRVEFEVLEIKIGDVTVVPKDSVALGTVTEAQSKRRMGRGGKLEIVMDSMRLADGEKAALRATKDVKGGGHTGAMAAGIVVTGLILWPAAPSFLFMHGKDITIPKGTEVPTFVSGNFPLHAAKFRQNEPGAQPQVLPVAAQSVSAKPEPTSIGTLRITSVPGGADIYVDELFVGNAPSVLKVASGKHGFRVSKTGFTDWKRDLTVQPDSDVNLTAPLESTNQ